jgi:hypothetical protein
MPPVPGMVSPEKSADFKIVAFTVCISSEQVLPEAMVTGNATVLTMYPTVFVNRGLERFAKGIRKQNVSALFPHIGKVQMRKAAEY